jgi:aldose 1-epimerase
MIEIQLRFENQFALVSSFGASLRRYAIGDWDVIWGYEGPNKKGGQGDVLAPFPGRIRDGKYSFMGEKFQLEKNDKDGPNAIHGFLRNENWEIVDQSETAALFRFRMSDEVYRPRGYPFSLEIEVAYELDERGLTTTFQITNTGDDAAPVGIGFHPYFTLGVPMSETIVTIPAIHYLPIENFVPNGTRLNVTGTGLDFRGGREIKQDKFNDCLTNLHRDLDGMATATLRSPKTSREISISMDESFDHIVIYTGDQIPAPDARQAFAIEPLTCAPDAFNHRGWGAKLLEPDETFSGFYTINGRG